MRGFDDVDRIFKGACDARVTQFVALLALVKGLRDDAQLPTLAVADVAWYDAPRVTLTSSGMRERALVSIETKLDKTDEPEGERALHVVITDVDEVAGVIEGDFVSSVCIARAGWIELAHDIVKRLVHDLERSAATSGEQREVIAEQVAPEVDIDERVDVDKVPSFFDDESEESKQAELDALANLRAIRVRAKRERESALESAYDEDFVEEHVGALVADIASEVGAAFATELMRVIGELGVLPTRSYLRSNAGEFTEKRLMSGLCSRFPAQLLDAYRPRMNDEVWCLSIVDFIEYVVARMRWFARCSPTAERGGSNLKLVDLLIEWALRAELEDDVEVDYSREEPEEGWNQRASTRLASLTQRLRVLMKSDVEDSAPTSDVLDMRVARSLEGSKVLVDASAFDEEWPGREKTKGKRGVIFSGEPRAKALAKLKHVLGLADLSWIDSSRIRQVQASARRIKRGSTQVVIQTRKFMTHKASAMVSAAVKSARKDSKDVLFLVPDGWGHAEIRSLLEMQTDDSDLDTDSHDVDSDLTVH